MGQTNLLRHLAFMIVCLLCIRQISNAFHCIALLRFWFMIVNTEKKSSTTQAAYQIAILNLSPVPFWKFLSFLKESARAHLNARSSRIRLCDLNFLCIFILQQLYEFFFEAQCICAIQLHCLGHLKISALFVVCSNLQRSSERRKYDWSCCLG